MSPEHSEKAGLAGAVLRNCHPLGEPIGSFGLASTPAALGQSPDQPAQASGSSASEVLRVGRRVDVEVEMIMLADVGGPVRVCGGDSRWVGRV